MKNYATFLTFGALCLFACASEPEPSAQTGSHTTAGMGTPTGNAGTPSTSAGSAATPGIGGSTGSAGAGGNTATGSAGKPAVLAGTGGSAIPPAAGSGGAAGSTMAAGGAGTTAAGSGTPPKGSFLAAYTLALRDMCMSCHAQGGIFGSPDLSSPDKAYESLVDKDASTMAPGQCGGKGKLVTPGNCETSIVYSKITQMTPICGRRMPLSSDAAPQIIPQAGVDALCDWIKAGAKKDM